LTVGRTRRWQHAVVQRLPTLAPLDLDDLRAIYRLRHEPDIAARAYHLLSDADLDALAHGGFDEIELVDLAEVNLPFMNEPHHPRLGKYSHQHTRD